MTNPTSQRIDESRRSWIDVGQSLAVLTIFVLMGGAANNLIAQYGQVSSDPVQAATNAALSTQMSGLTTRVTNIEGKIDYLLMGITMAVIIQLVQFKTSRKP